ncbi:MAG: hypothetical protein QNJ54_34710 [Prochloraceae cyanobacterium]|nr:hypothetical protein [Prochloraceae cyanobacterium]
MLANYRLGGWGLLSLILGVLIGCAPMVKKSSNPINLYKRNILEISALSKKPNLNSTVYIEGKVVKIVAFLDSGAYQLQDNTNTIWVKTQNSLPIKGERLVVKGEIHYQKFDLLYKKDGEFYLKEIEQIKVEDPDAPVKSVISQQSRIITVSVMDLNHALIRST